MKMMMIAMVSALAMFAAGCASTQSGVKGAVSCCCTDCKCEKCCCATGDCAECCKDCCNKSKAAACCTSADCCPPGGTCKGLACCKPS